MQPVAAFRGGFGKITVPQSERIGVHDNTAVFAVAGKGGKLFAKRTHPARAAFQKHRVVALRYRVKGKACENLPVGAFCKHKNVARSAAFQFAAQMGHYLVGQLHIPRLGACGNAFYDIFFKPAAGEYFVSVRQNGEIIQRLGRQSVCGKKLLRSFFKSADSERNLLYLYHQSYKSSYSSFIAAIFSLSSSAE